MCISVYFPSDKYKKNHVHFTFVLYDLQIVPLSYDSRMKIIPTNKKSYMWIIQKRYLMIWCKPYVHHIWIIWFVTYDSYTMPFFMVQYETIWSIYNSQMWSICGEAACVYKRHTIWLSSNHSFKQTKYRRTPKPKSFVKQLLT